MNKISQLCLLLIVIVLSSSASLAGSINAINIKGNQRIEKSTILEYLGMGVGDQYSEEARSEAVKNLYGTSLFENIDIAFNDGVLSVNVLETPFVSKVVFVGNNKVKTKVLTAEMQTIAGESLKKSKLRSDVEKIKEIYKRSGRFSVHVSSRIESQENNRVKVIFEVEEGPKTGIRNINFVGNENYRDSELKTIILTKEARWFRFLESNDTYDPERIEYDKYLLKQFYNSVGFADCRIISVTADLRQNKDGFVLTYSIDEGKKYKFGQTTLLNKLKSIKDEEISKFFTKNEGSTFNMNLVQKMADKITDYLAGKGYPQVDVHPDIRTNPAKGTVDVVIVVDQADKIFINNINIYGNLKTEDHVIRRELKIAEGDVYNKGKIERGERSLRNLDYFSKLSLKLSPTQKDDRYDINIDVEEKSTASVGFDVGYNTAGGVFGRVSFLERNLIGTGKYLNAGIQAGKKSIYYYAGLTEPNFMDRDLSLGGSVFRSENGRGSGFTNQDMNYSMKSTGAKVNLGYEIVDDLTHSIDYLIKRDSLKAPKSTASVYIQEQMGNFVTSAVGHSLTLDKTDSRVLPKNGFLLTGSQEYAGVGGNNKYLKHELEGKAFKSFFENKFTMIFSASAGHIKGLNGRKVRISDRFNLGDYTLRGFEQAGIGPRDKVTDEGLGGQKYYALSTEVNFPLGLPEEFNVSGALFVDVGSLWDADSKISKSFYNDKALRGSTGFGVIWVTRFAPIRLDWGFPFKKQKYDQKQNGPHIKFSTHF